MTDTPEFSLRPALPGDLRAVRDLVEPYARERILLPAICTACPDRAACDLCPAVAYAEHADFTAVPEYLCARTAEYLAICQKALADPAVESDNSGKNGTIS